MNALLLALCAIRFSTFTSANQNQSDPRMIDLTNAVVVASPMVNTPEAKAVQMLVEEVEKRSRVRWPVLNPAQPSIRPKVAIVTDAPINGRWPAESYLLQTKQTSDSPQVTIMAHDARGVLFGIGRLLRNLRMERDRITIPSGLAIMSSPYHPLRGHQLGYRPKTNSYDAWTVQMWEQYIRDLAVFGANAVELIPPRSDDDVDSPHFPLPPMNMMIEMSRLLDQYGMDVWVWYPAMDKDYSNPTTVDRAVKEWAYVFKKLPRIDAIFVPGGDPGHTQPKHLMALLEKQTASLHKYHPKAQMWVSPQGFTQAWMDEFISILKLQQPKWLSGIVFGPQVRTPLPRLREIVPKQYPIRHYPDITHSRQCQFPVPDWDLAYAITEGRESISPRPTQEAVICKSHQAYTIGSITYSEGCNDDVNKAVWSALEWDPKADIAQVLREYSRYFISARFDMPFAEVLMHLEQNWEGPVSQNTQVPKTLKELRLLEAQANPREKLNWRFQQALYRAYYDAYLQLRVIRETNIEKRALDALARAPEIGWERASSETSLILNELDDRRSGADLRQRIFESAEALFQSIRMQLSVKKYQAIGVERGANLDSVDDPVTDRRWIAAEVSRIAALPDEGDRIKALDALIHWSDPGPGGFYDEPGNPLHREHLIIGPGFKADPGSMSSVRTGIEGDDEGGRIRWRRYAETLYDTPLHMKYSGLDPQVSYKMRVVYGTDKPEVRIRCRSSNGVEVHPYLSKPKTPKPMEFDIPASAYARGNMELVWNREPGFGGNGRGCQISEIWIIKK